MNKKIIVSSLKARPVRTAVSVLAVALEVTLILVLVGLTTGIANETGRRIEGVGADIMFQPPNSSIILSLNSGSAMPQALADKIAEVEGVKSVAPILTMVNSQSSGLEIIYGIDPATFDAVSGGFQYHKGKLFSAPDEVIVDDWYASAKRVDVGDEVTLLNHTFRISGIVENGKGSRIFMSLKTAQDMAISPGRASMFYIKLHNPDDVAAVSEQIKVVFPTYTLHPLREFASLMTADNIPGLDSFIKVVVFVAVCIGVLVIFLSMYTTITERTREIGILRSLGASKPFIVTLILQESLFLCILGTVIGLGSSLLIAKVVQVTYPTLVVMITMDWMATAALFAVLSGLIGSLYPSIKAAAQDPVEALAYE